MDRGGNPTINPFITPDGEKDLYNSRQPVDDVTNYLGPWSKVLEKGGYPPDEARQAALMFLPDILRYDRSRPVAYPNGRHPTHDRLPLSLPPERVPLPRPADPLSRRAAAPGLRTASPCSDADLPTVCTRLGAGPGSPAPRWTARFLA